MSDCRRRRAAIYARFSTDLQSDRSVDDQVALCRDHAARQGLDVVETYADRARSGSSIFGRDGLLSLLEAARGGAFDVVLVEALDRLSRDQEDLAGIYKRLTFGGVAIEAVHDGTANPISIGIRGLIGEIYLSDLAHKVRRGMQGVVRGGRHPGGRAYGYRPVAGRPGVLAIDEAEAAIVRRIFRDYVAGISPRRIAHDLNADGVPAPRGEGWGASTINGNRTRGYGIVQNPIYDGRIVWNRVRMVRDPATGRRVSRANPPSEWQEAEAPDLAIVDRATYRAAQARKERLTRDPATGRPRKPHMLSGLLRCGACGGGLVVKDERKGRRRMRCSNAYEKATCGARGFVMLDAIEGTVVAALRGIVADPGYLAAYVEAYRREMQELNGDRVRQRDRLAAKLANVEGQLGRLVDALADGRLPPDVVGERAEGLTQERGRLREALRRLEAEIPVVELHPEAARKYRRDVEQLAEALAFVREHEDATETGAALRALVAEVVVDIVAKTVEIRGRLAQLTGNPQIAPQFKTAVGEAWGKSVVAEARLAPFPPLISLGIFRFEGPRLRA